MKLSQWDETRICCEKKKCHHFIYMTYMSLLNFFFFLEQNSLDQLYLTKVPTKRQQRKYFLAQKSLGFLRIFLEILFPNSYKFIFEFYFSMSLILGWKFTLPCFCFRFSRSPVLIHSLLGDYDFKLLARLFQKKKIWLRKLFNYFMFYTILNKLIEISALELAV